MTTFNGTSDVLSLKILTRIGTNGAGAFCGGHSNAVGLRLYFDAVSRPSKFTAIFKRMMGRNAAFAPSVWVSNRSQRRWVQIRESRENSLDD